MEHLLYSAMHVTLLRLICKICSVKLSSVNSTLTSRSIVRKEQHKLSKMAPLWASFLADWRTNRRSKIFSAFMRPSESLGQQALSDAVMLEGMCFNYLMDPRRRNGIGSCCRRNRSMGTLHV